MEKQLKETMQMVDLLLQRVLYLEEMVDQLAKEQGHEIEWQKTFVVNDYKLY